MKILSGIAGREIQYDSLDCKIKILGLVRERKRLEEAALDLVPRYDGELHLAADDYMIVCDYHSPYFSVLWHNRMLAVAEKLDVRKIIIIGDLVDCAFASYYYSEHKPALADEADENKRLLRSFLDSFEEIILIKGNHEDRLGRLTDAKVTIEILLENWTREAWGTQIKYSSYDKLFIGDEWMLVHPKSYSQISGNVSKRLAAKFHRHIINTHGHFVAWGYDVSGEYLSVDLGGMFDLAKIEYVNMKTTTHPLWGNGFGVLRNNHFTLFDKMTDWGQYK